MALICRLWISERRPGLDPRVWESVNPSVSSLPLSLNHIHQCKIGDAIGPPTLPVDFSPRDMFPLQPTVTVDNRWLH